MSLQNYVDDTSLVPMGTFDATTGLILTGSQAGYKLSNYYTPQNAMFVVDVPGNISLSGITTWNKGDQAYSTGFIWQRIPTGLSSGGGTATDTEFTPIPGVPANNVEDAIAYLSNQYAPQYAALDPITAVYQVVYQDNSTGEVGLAIANDPVKADAVGFALNLGLSGEAITAQSAGYITNTTWTFTIGQAVYLSSTVAGDVTQTPPTVGEYFMQLGVASSVDTIRINLMYNGLVW